MYSLIHISPRLPKIHIFSFPCKPLYVGNSMKIAIKFFQTLVIAVAISVTLLSIPGMAAPAAAQECNGPAVLPRSHGMSRINVKDFNKSMDYYQNTLKLKCNPTFFTPPIGQSSISPTARKQVSGSILASLLNRKTFRCNFKPSRRDCLDELRFLPLHNLN